jgi:hypothetical protein
VNSTEDASHSPALAYRNQVTDDTGSGARLGSFESRVIGDGPEVGLLFPIEDVQAYANLRAYKDFDADHRPEGRNVWLTLSFSPAPSKSSEVDKDWVEHVTAFDFR